MPGVEPAHVLIIGAGVVGTHALQMAVGMGARVTVIGYAWPGHTPSRPQETIVLGEQDVRNEAASAPRKLAWLARAIAGNLTFSSAKMRMVDAASVRRQIDRAGPFDAYVLNSVQFAGAFESLFDDRPSLFVALKSTPGVGVLLTIAYASSLLQVAIVVP